MIDDFFVQCVGTGINEMGIKPPFRVFPNPTADYISILSDNSAILKSVSVKNSLGQHILTTDKTTIDLRQFDAGIYFYEVTDIQMKTTIGRFIKQ